MTAPLYPLYACLGCAWQFYSAGPSDTLPCSKCGGQVVRLAKERNAERVRELSEGVRQLVIGYLESQWGDGKVAGDIAWHAARSVRIRLTRELKRQGGAQ